MSFGYFLLGAGALTIATGLVFAKYMGFFKKIAVRDIIIGPSYLIYTRYTGDYKNLMPACKRVKEDLARFCSADESSLRLAPTPDQLNTFGFYYDNPALIVDQNQSRAVLGGILPISGPVPESVILEVLERLNASGSENKYHFEKFTKPLKGFGAVFPLFNVLSIFYAVVRGYPIIKKYGNEMNLTSKISFSVEIYDRNAKELTILFPYEGEVDRLFLSDAPQPAYHPAPDNKND